MCILSIPFRQSQLPVPLDGKDATLFEILSTVIKKELIIGRTEGTFKFPKIVKHPCEQRRNTEPNENERARWRNLWRLIY